MKNICLIFLLIAAATSTTLAQTQKERVNALRESVAEAYKTKTMAKLDEKRLIQGSVLLRIVHSLMEGRGSLVRRNFKTFAQLDAWLKKGERAEGAPFRQVSDVVTCTRGHCEYSYDTGILHNQLYLQDISYRFRKGKLYIVKIDLLDGD